MNFSTIKKAAFIALLGSAACVSAQEGSKAEDAKPDAKTEIKPEVVVQDFSKEKETLSFGHGFNVGKQLLDQKEFINSDIFMKGLKAALAGEKNPTSEADFRAAIQKLEPLMRAAHQKKQADAQAEAMKKMEEDKKLNVVGIQNFLKETLTKTASGLEYKVVKKGEGEMPKAVDTVTVHYTGFLTDGTKFDSSVDRGQPASFPLNGVIKGWTEGVQLMKVGSKYRFKIPGALAYGPAGSPPKIPPNATLVFDIELIAIKKAQ
jgi:FKBP-type peptidyl-prolyl cis-trans isomerase FkpA